MDQEYGVLIDSKKFGIRQQLLREMTHQDIYRTPILEHAETQAINQLTAFKDKTMVASIVPLNDGESFGKPIKRYILDDSMEVIEHQPSPD
jgi:hypothetical protein